MSTPTIDAILAAPLERAHIEAAAQLLHDDPAGWPAIEVRAHEVLVEPKTLFATWRAAVRSCADLIRKAEAEAKKLAKKMEAEAERLRRIEEREASKAKRAEEREAERATKLRGVVEEAAELRAGGAPTFARADAPSLARQLLLDVRGESSEEVAYDRGLLWVYEDHERVWAPRYASQLKNKIADWSGALVVGRKGWRELEIQGTATILDFAYSLPAEWGYHQDIGFFSAAPEGLPMASSFLHVSPDLRELKSEPLGPQHRVTWKLPIDWDGAPRRGELWERYLSTVFEGEEDAAQKVALLQEFAGAALMGLAPQFQQALLLVGDGGNGKSVFLDVLAALIPEGARSNVNPADLGGSTGSYYRAALDGKRLNVVQEMPTTEILQSNAFKAAVSGNALDARQPGGQVFRFTPRAAWAISANVLPPVSDTSAGFWRRWIVVEFKQRFSGARKVRKLEEKIIAQELDAVTCWALDGARRLLAQEGYTQVASVAAAAHEWRRETDAVLTFFEDHLRDDPADPQWVQASTLYNAFIDFCTKSLGMRSNPFPISATRFGRRLRALGVAKDDRHNFPTAKGVAAYRCRCAWNQLVTCAEDAEGQP